MTEEESLTIDPLLPSEKKEYEQRLNEVRSNELAATTYIVALKIIRDRRLYREQYRTFEEFCNLETTLSARRVNQLLLAHKTRQEIVKHLGKPVSQSQDVESEKLVESLSAKSVAHLAKITPQKAIEVIEKLKEGKDVTAKEVERAVARVSKRELPKPAVSKLDELLAEIDKLSSHLCRNVTYSGFDHKDVINDVLKRVRVIVKTVLS